MELFLKKGKVMPVPRLGTRKNPIKIGCADISSSDDKIGECIIKTIQRKIGFNNGVFKDRRYKQITVVIEKKNCCSCPIGLNICKVETVVIPKKAVDEYKQKMALAM